MINKLPAANSVGINYQNSKLQPNIITNSPMIIKTNNQANSSTTPSKIPTPINITAIKSIESKFKTHFNNLMQ